MFKPWILDRRIKTMWQSQQMQKKHLTNSAALHNKSSQQIRWKTSSHHSSGGIWQGPGEYPTPQWATRSMVSTSIQGEHLTPRWAPQSRVSTSIQGEHRTPRWASHSTVKVGEHFLEDSEQHRVPSCYFYSSIFYSSACPGSPHPSKQARKRTKRPHSSSGDTEDIQTSET
jgi:hypothetical protein